MSFGFVILASCTIITYVTGVGERRIEAFASEFDPQPFHLDGELAKGTLFGGWHTAALTMRLLVDGACP
ncbi:acyl dehydratase [Bradyrhizobium embrapense]